MKIHLLHHGLYFHPLFLSSFLKEMRSCSEMVRTHKKWPIGFLLCHKTQLTLNSIAVSTVNILDILLMETVNYITYSGLNVFMLLTGKT